MENFDRQSAAWFAIKRWAEAYAAQAREALEYPGLDPVSTEFQRGKIAAVKALLEAPDPIPAPPALKNHFP